MRYIGSKDWQCRQLAAQGRLPRFRQFLLFTRGALLVCCVIHACALLVSCIWFLTVQAAVDGPLCWLFFVSAIAICAGFLWLGVHVWQEPPHGKVREARQALLAVYNPNTTPDELVDMLHWRIKAVQQAHVDWDDGGTDYRDTDGNLATFHGVGLPSLLDSRTHPGLAASGSVKMVTWLYLLASLWGVAFYAVAMDPEWGQALHAASLVPVACTLGPSVLLAQLADGYGHWARRVALVELARDISSDELARRPEIATAEPAL